MMTELNAPVHRVSQAIRRERGRTRRIVSSLVPPAFVSFRLAGERVSYLLDIEVAYELAARQFVRQVEITAKQIAKAEGIRMSSARKRAHKQVREEMAAAIAAGRRRNKN